MYASKRKATDMTLDFTSDHGTMALKHLENDIVIWLTTVTPGGMPQPNPVWFVWDKDSKSVIVWVQPGSARIRNFESNRQVSLHFATDELASHMTVLTGLAEIDEELGSLADHPPHLEKYAERWQNMDMPIEVAARDYSVPIRIRPTKLRGF